jgi:prepilin-type N-terminal cleavage/methylation domain-containing protein
MGLKKNIRGFTLLEVLLASAIMVAMTTVAAVGIGTLLDYKKNENAKLKLAYEALQVLDEIERNGDNRSVSMGNLLVNEQAYPFQFQPLQIREDGSIGGYPFLGFFVRFPEGPRAMGYGLGPLPAAINDGASAAIGLFRFILGADDSRVALENFSPGSDLGAAFPAGDRVKLANLVSDTLVFFEVHLIKLAADGFSLEYLNGDGQPIEMYAGEWTLGTSHPTDIAFTEIAVGLLPKSLHGQYFALTSAAKKFFLAKNGIQLSRMLPWRI